MSSGLVLRKPGLTPAGWAAWLKSRHHITYLLVNQM